MRNYATSLNISIKVEQAKWGPCIWIPDCDSIVFLNFSQLKQISCAVFQYKKPPKRTTNREHIVSPSLPNQIFTPVYHPSCRWGGLQLSKLYLHLIIILKQVLNKVCPTSSFTSNHLVKSGTIQGLVGKPKFFFNSKFSILMKCLCCAYIVF